MLRKLLNMIEHKAYIRKLKKRGVSIAKDVEIVDNSFGDYVNIAHHAQCSYSNIGLRTSIGRFSKIRYANIGKYCSISWDVTIGATEHSLHALSSHSFTYRAKFGICDKNREINHSYVNIGNDVWIGCGAIILPGVSIGNGAVIGAGAVVTKDVHPYEIVAGCPARSINMRFPTEIVELLEYFRWWDKDDDFIKDHIDLFSTDINLVTNNDVINKIKAIVDNEN